MFLDTYEGEEARGRAVIKAISYKSERLWDLIRL
jgi:hypothetical protein